MKPWRYPGAKKRKTIPASATHVIALIASAATGLAPGGRLIWIHPTTTNLERHAKPSARFLLDLGEAEAPAVVGSQIHLLQVTVEEAAEADGTTGPIRSGKGANAFVHMNRWTRPAEALSP